MVIITPQPMVSTAIQREGLNVNHFSMTKFDGISGITSAVVNHIKAFTYQKQCK